MAEFPAAFPLNFGAPPPPPPGLRQLEGTSLEWVESHCARAKELIINKFRGRPRFEATLCALTAGVQDFHDAVYQVLIGRWLSTAWGVQLDYLGEILRKPRAGWVDDTYRRILRATRTAQTSDGTRRALVSILRQLGLDVTILDIWPHPPGAVVYSLGEQFGEFLAPIDAFNLLYDAKVGGVRLDLEYPVGVDLEDTFTWADGDVDQADTLRGWADDASTLGGYWADVITRED